MPKLEVGCKVELTGKNVQGKVAFIGQTHFETGTWVGIILNEPKGKNNGIVKNRQGISKTYFEVIMVYFYLNLYVFSLPNNIINNYLFIILSLEIMII